MKYPATEKLEIIRLVERSHLPVRRTLDKLGVSRPTFYRWYDLYHRFGDAGREDRRGGPRRVWNRIPDTVRGQVLDLALEEPELIPISVISDSHVRRQGLGRAVSIAIMALPGGGLRRGGRGGARRRLIRL